MIIKDLRMQKFADLIVKVGVNVQKNQQVFINCSVDCAEFARVVVKAAYQAGASSVSINWSDGIINKEYYLHAPDEILAEVPEYIINKFQYIVANNAAVISITSPEPGLLADIDGYKLQLANKAIAEKVDFYRQHMSANGSQWVVVAYPNVAWAKKVFPELSETDAMNKLWDAILKASYVDEQNNPIQAWEDHIRSMAQHNDALNKYNFKELHFENSIGTNLHVELVNNHIWAGGAETAQNGVLFAPNIPTEESFTMPNRNGVNGVVVSTKPLNYQGKLVEEFSLKFEQGKVVEYDAKKGLDVLTNLLETDEGSCRLGEVALISYASPISMMNILFYNTLFDENASCHLALGNAYPMNVVGGIQMTKEELIKAGANKSLVHVDFMFGSSDMKITGITQNNQKVLVFKDGNFVF